MEKIAESRKGEALSQALWPTWARVLIFALAGLTIGPAALLIMGVTPISFVVHSGPFPLRAIGFALLVPALGLLLFRQRYPVEILAFTAITLVASDLLDLPRWLFFVPFVPAAFNAIMLGHRRATWGALALAFVSTLWLPGNFSGYSTLRFPGIFVGYAAPTFHNVIALFAWLLVLGGVAEGARVHRERRMERARARVAEERRRANEERLRVARELHDVLGHDISLINVQASAALHVWEQQPEQARFALSAIKDASKAALTELRTVLDVLRSEGETSLRAPSPSLDRLDDLIAQAESAGLKVRVAVTGEKRRVPAAVDLAAYRIVQESLTNVMRHAGPATAYVQLAYAPGELTLQVDDDGRGPVGPEGAGHGIAGMRDRSAALGGTLDAKARPDGGFRVRSWLPWRVEP